MRKMLLAIFTLGMLSMGCMAMEEKRVRGRSDLIDLMVMGHDLRGPVITGRDLHEIINFFEDIVSGLLSRKARFLQPRPSEDDHAAIELRVTRSSNGSGFQVLEQIQNSGKTHYE